jgi:uncharacterized protein with PQ loop repeat
MAAIVRELEQARRLADSGKHMSSVPKLRWKSALGSLAMLVMVETAVISATLEATKLADYFPEPVVLAFFAVTAPVSSVCLNLGPVTQVAAAVDRKDPTVVNVPVHVSQIVASILNGVWGLRKGNTPLFGASMFNLGVNLLFLCIYVELRVRGGTVSLAFTFALMALHLGLCMCLSYLTEAVLASLLIVVAMMSTLSTMAKLETVLRTRNAEGIPLSVVIPLMMCNMLWTVYSAFRNDFAIFIVSVTAVGVAIFQAIVVFWCRVDSPMDLSFLLFLFSSRPVEEKGRAEAEKVELLQQPSPSRLNLRERANQISDSSGSTGELATLGS